MKKLALSDPKKFNSLAQDLEKKFEVDSEYTYASLTRKIFDDDMLEKMRTGLGDENQNLSTEKLYKLNIYGLSKAIEGSGFGYKDANEYSVQWAFEKYESYLKSIGRSLKDKEATEYKLGIGDTQDELRKMEKYKSLIYALESYMKKDTSRLNKISEDYTETFGLTGGDDIRYTILELERGLFPVARPAKTTAKKSGSTRSEFLRNTFPHTPSISQNFARVPHLHFCTSPHFKSLVARCRAFPRTSASAEAPSFAWWRFSARGTLVITILKKCSSLVQ